MTHVLIVDDHPIVIQGCRRVLQDMGVETISGADGIVSGYRAYLRQRPDIVITDLSFESDDLGGLALIRRISDRDPDAKILVVSMHNDPAIVSRTLMSGAKGYVLKDAASAELAQAIGRLSAGEPHLDHEMAMKVAMLRAKNDRSPINALTERETQILALLAQGNNNDKIAAKLGISYKTVTNATALIRSKLKLGSLAELIRFAIQNKSDLASQ